MSMSTARKEDFSEFSFAEMVSYYSELRGILYEELNSEYPQFKCSPISFSDALQADKWRYADTDVGRDAWLWKGAYNGYTRKSGFKRFDLSIKKGALVAGLAYGEPTHSKTNLKIDIIEATPFEAHKQDIRIFEVISRAAQYYAALLGADEVRVMNPLNENLVDYYCSFGYDFVIPKKKRLGVYCSMKI